METSSARSLKFIYLGKVINRHENTTEKKTSLAALVCFGCSTNLHLL